MLLSLSIENFKGFSEPVKILANAEDMRMDENVQPIFCRLRTNQTHPFSLRIDNTVAVWGANLSGKTTLFNALKTIQAIILDEPFEYTPNTFFGSDAPTKLAIDFCYPTNSLYKTFRYEVEYNASGITQEHLYQINEAAYNPLLKEEATTGQISETKNAGSYLNEIKTLNKHDPKSDPTGSSIALQKFAKHMFFVPKDASCESKELLEVAKLPMKQSYHLLQALKLFDPSLVTIQVSGNSLEFVHEMSEKSRKKFSFSEEPESFRTFTNLMGAVESAASRSGIVIADDIDSIIHPCVLQDVVYLFSLQNFYNLAPMQLIATFVNTTNMDYLQLRRDSIWFLQYTHPYRALFSLAEYKEDQEEFLWLSYLRGRYGWTVPEIPVAFGRDNRI